MSAARKTGGVGEWAAFVLSAVVIAAASLIVSGQSITIPNTFTNGTVADANQVNANFNALASNACNRADCTMSGATKFVAGSVTAPGLTFTGDLNTGFYSSGADALDFTTGGVKAFGIDSTQFIDSPTQPRAVAYHNTTQSLTSGVRTALLLNNEDLDVGSLHSTSSNTSRITIPSGGDGYYFAFAQVSFAAGGGTNREATIEKNGTTDVATSLVMVSTVFMTINVEWAGALVAGDYLEAMGVQDSGGAVNSGSATRTNSNALTVTKLW